NLVTRQSFEGSSVQYTLGAFPTRSGRLAATGRFVGIAAPEGGSLDATWHPWAAFEAADDQGPFVTPEALQRYNLFAKVTGDLSSRLSVGAFAQAYGSGWIGSGQIPAREVAAGRLDNFGSVDPSEGGLTERQMMTAFLHYVGERSTLDPTAYVTRYRLSLWDDFTFFLADPVNGDLIEQDDARVFAGARLRYEVEQALGGIVTRTALGAEMRHDAIHVD